MVLKETELPRKVKDDHKHFYPWTTRDGQMEVRSEIYAQKYKEFDMFIKNGRVAPD